ncbi:hypothetical protein ACIBTP_32135 [Streptomyces avidinii]|uniref:hypothetical protein n=1 Tax=Streptomyces avidinii TaxID=1895 RepID=UPI0037993A9B
MRKALTLVAVALASSMALGGAAFAADAPAPAPTTPTPTSSATPSQVSSLRLSADFGRPGDKVRVTVRTGEKDASVTSQAFEGGRVDLKDDGHGTWTGTAVVAKDVRTGYYGVRGFAGGKQFDTVTFSTEAKSGPDVKPKPRPTPTPSEHTKPHAQPQPQPLKPSEHKVPKGSVNTGEAPAGYAPGTGNG